MNLLRFLIIENARASKAIFSSLFFLCASLLITSPIHSMEENNNNNQDQNKKKFTPKQEGNYIQGFINLGGEPQKKKKRSDLIEILVKSQFLSLFLQNFTDKSIDEEGEGTFNQCFLKDQKLTKDGITLTIKDISKGNEKIKCSEFRNIFSKSYGIEISGLKFESEKGMIYAYFSVHALKSHVSGIEELGKKKLTLDVRMSVRYINDLVHKIFLEGMIAGVEENKQLQHNIQEHNRENK